MQSLLSLSLSKIEETNLEANSYGWNKRSKKTNLIQFLNVFLGNMSIVGPRPHPIQLNDLYRDRIEKFSLRHQAKPGITGLAQVKGYRGSIMFFHQIDARVKLDRFYIQNWTFFLDLKIILLTITAVMKGQENVY